MTKHLDCSENGSQPTRSSLPRRQTRQGSLVFSSSRSQIRLIVTLGDLVTRPLFVFAGGGRSSAFSGCVFLRVPDQFPILARRISRFYHHGNTLACSCITLRPLLAGRMLPFSRRKFSLPFSQFVGSLERSSRVLSPLSSRDTELASSFILPNRFSTWWSLVSPSLFFKQISAFRTPPNKKGLSCGKSVSSMAAQSVFAFGWM